MLTEYKESKCSNFLFNVWVPGHMAIDGNEIGDN